MENENIQLNAGGGGSESERLVADILKGLPRFSAWHGRTADSAVLRYRGKNLVFTTDSYVVSPLFFPGGDIGKLAIGGTINDLAVCGAKPLGISLALVIEEGFSKADLQRILRSISLISRQEKIQVVTGDTKVMDRGKVDGIVINTSGIGETDKVISNSGLRLDQVIIASGSLGDHAATLLAKRFKYTCRLKSDCQPIWSQIKKVKSYLTACKDPTRGGLSSVIHEMAKKGNVKIILDEANIPLKKETRAICDLLGVSPYDLASEGRFVAGLRQRDAKRALSKIKGSRIIGRVESGGGVWLKGKFGERQLPRPEGKLLPRIC